MGLSEYKKKRSFSKTPEPEGGKAENDKLRFVIQKHAASHLHYDFRLEMEGVLKSWAVPKGPSLDPSVKRLAMMVEDHPYDYRNFEGIIPQGQYGGGTVIVWDEGFYEAIESKGKTKKEQEKDLLKQLRGGSLKFTMKGKKLKGEFALVKVRGRGDNGWLLIKHRDDYASTDDITEKDKSVLSKKTLEQVAKTSTNIYGRTKKPAAKKAAAKTVKKKSAEKSEADQAHVKRGKKTALPVNLKPMLATLVDKPFDKEGWVYEIKWDGYRALAFMNGKQVMLQSRNDKSFNDKFYPVYEELKSQNLKVVLDGEVVVLNEKGISDFGALQNWRSEADGALIYYVFDLLWLDGNDLRELPLNERRRQLLDLIPETDTLRISQYFVSSGTDFFEAAKKLEMEGIIAKKEDSLYLSGQRSSDWLKIKANKRQEVVVGGFTKNEGSSKHFSSLLVGVFDQKHFKYIGKIGTGFNEKQQREMMAKFKPLITEKSPFEVLPDVNKPSRFRPDPPDATATWLKPKLVCEVSYTEMTRDGVMRHPSFEGLRMDKAAAEVVREKPVHTMEVVKKKEKAAAKKMRIAPAKSSRKTLLNPTDAMQVRQVNGHELKFNNLNKIYWPDVKVSKRDMLNYYYQVAPFMLPYLSDRPQSLNRHPNGINGKSFYQKDVTDKVPGWVKTFPYFSEGEAQQKNFFVCTDESSLLYIAAMGCIEINPWSSRIQSPDQPDWCIIDLDPGKNTFNEVIEAAQICKELLDAIKVPCYCKTSGSTGLHVYIPLGAKYSYERSKEFARIIARQMTLQLPKFTSIERVVAKRKGKMYIDFLQNRLQATLAAPYSLRPKPGATVSMPLHWEEVKKGLKMKDFTIFNALDRVRTEGDIFKKVLGKGIDLDKALRAAAKIFEL